MGLRQRWDPDKAPYAYPERTVDGKITLRLPSPEYRDLPPSWRTECHFQLGRTMNIGSKSLICRLYSEVTDIFYFGRWLDTKIRIKPISSRKKLARVAWAELLSRRPRYESLLAGVQPANIGSYVWPLAAEDSEISREAFTFTAFALDQFMERTERDNVSLIILSEYMMKSSGHRAFDRLNTMTEERGILVINLYDYLVRQGQSLEDVRWKHNAHWNPTGHQRAAEALLEYLREHPEVCAG